MALGLLSRGEVTGNVDTFTTLLLPVQALPPPFISALYEVFLGLFPSFRRSQFFDFRSSFFVVWGDIELQFAGFERGVCACGVAVALSGSV